MPLSWHRGGESKTCFIQAGLALVWAQKAGLRVGLISEQRSDW
jgi:hypothetical protein